MTSSSILDAPVAVPVAGRPVEAPLARLRGFHPGWYGAVMGTAIVGIIAYQNPGDVATLHDAQKSASTNADNIEAATR